MYVTLVFNYIKTNIYGLGKINHKSFAYGLVIFLLVLLVCTACVPATDDQGYTETNNIQAESINDCVKGAAANTIKSQDFPYCVESTEEILTKSKNKELNDYLNALSNSELQITYTNIFAKQAPAGNNQILINSILQKVRQLSSYNTGSDNDYDDDQDDDDHDHGGHDHGDHEH